MGLVGKIVFIVFETGSNTDCIYCIYFEPSQIQKAVESRAPSQLHHQESFIYIIIIIRPFIELEAFADEATISASLWL